jgi:hypothetical protein
LRAGHATVAPSNPEGLIDAILLRQATHADAAAPGRLHVTSWHETYAGLLPDAMLAALSVDAHAEM